jgi:hypothetical protein
MGLAWDVNHGIFYRPLEAGGYYGGTRYLPLFFLLVAGLARVVRSYLVAAKLASAAGVALLAGAAAAVGRRLTGRWQGGLVTAGLVLAVRQGLQTVVLPHTDALAAALSVWGLLLLETIPGRFRIVGPAVFFSLALAAKVTTVAGLGAALVYLLTRDRRAALRLLLLVVALGGAGFALLQLGSDGRFLDNLRSVGGGGLGWDSVRQGPAKMLHLLLQSQGFLLLLALALFSLLARLRPFRLDLWDWNLLAATGTTLVILTSPGTLDNHLTEMETAAILVCARFLAVPAGGSNALAAEPPLLRAVGPWVILAVLLLSARFHAGTWQGDEGAIPARELVEALPGDQPILTEMPTASVLRGERPVVLDSFTFRLLAERGRIDETALAERLGRHEFAVLVMLGRIDRPHESFCPDVHFGPTVTEAMCRHYRFDRQVGAFFLYVPTP